MTELRFTVDGKPVAWQRTSTWQGRKLTPKGQRAYQAKVRHAALVAMTRKWNPDQRFAVKVVAYGHPKQRFDLDNVAKQIGDALNGVVWTDDRRIDVFGIVRRVDRERPRVEVHVVAYDPAAERADIEITIGGVK